MEGKGQVKKHGKELCTKTRGGEDWLWEVGVARAGESSGGKMGTTVIEQE